jgi:hypothetical protein
LRGFDVYWSDILDLELLERGCTWNRRCRKKGGMLGRTFNRSSSLVISRNSAAKRDEESVIDDTSMALGGLGFSKSKTLDGSTRVCEDEASVSK